MKLLPIQLLVAVALLVSQSALLAGESAALPIRNRSQWQENNGYCGEMSLQECALYFGIYASQAHIRAVFDPTQQNDLVQISEWVQTLDALGLQAEFFPTKETPTPQYKAFSVWAKKHLARNRPVITTCYIAGIETDDSTSILENTNKVDHIITLTGFVADDLLEYSSDDTFTFNHHIDKITSGLPGAPFAFSQRARWLFDTRAMKGGGATYGYAIQKEVNYGLAITGVIGETKDERPVRLELDRITEPNIIAGEKPMALKAAIRVENLTPGLKYVLYRYNDPAAVPLKNHAEQPAASRISFQASGRVEKFNDSIPSDGVAIYRCLPVPR